MTKRAGGKKSAVKMSVAERVSVGTFPTGISYADRSIEVAGDYKRIAFLPFSTLALEWHARRVPEDVRRYITDDATKIQARRGQEYQVSSAGQTVRLGPAGGAGGDKTPAQLEREIGELGFVGRVGFLDRGRVGFLGHRGHRDLTVEPASHAATGAAPPAPPSATVLLQRRGRYVDDDAVMIGTARGDLADSHGAVHRALRSAKIHPTYLGVGSFKVAFDPSETDGEAAVSIVEGALRSAGIRVHRIDSRSAR